MDELILDSGVNSQGGGSQSSIHLSGIPTGVGAGTRVRKVGRRSRNKSKGIKEEEAPLFSNITGALQKSEFSEGADIDRMKERERQRPKPPRQGRRSAQNSDTEDEVYEYTFQRERPAHRSMLQGALHEGNIGSGTGAGSSSGTGTSMSTGSSQATKPKKYVRRRTVDRDGSNPDEWKPKSDLFNAESKPLGAESDNESVSMTKDVDTKGNKIVSNGGKIVSERPKDPNMFVDDGYSSNEDSVAEEKSRKEIKQNKLKELNRRRRNTIDTQVDKKGSGQSDSAKRHEDFMAKEKKIIFDTKPKDDFMTEIQKDSMRGENISVLIFTFFK